MIRSVNSLISKTILIVDDTPQNLQFLFEYLSDYGYKPLIANNGQKAIKTAKTVHPDLILLDVMMPKIDGFTTCHHLKSDNSTKDIPIIFMTALVETEKKVQAFKLGAVDYITKPIEEKELIARIDTHLSLQDLNRSLTRDVAEQKLLFNISDRIRQSLDLKSILQTATQEIRSFLECDLVWLACLQDENVSIKEISSNCLDLKRPENLPQDCFYQNLAEYQSYLQGNIRIIENHNNLTSTQSECRLNSQSRLITPILINSTNKEDTTTTNNSLWGWLIAEQCTSGKQWQREDIYLLKKVTTQLAIAIQQGLLYKEISKLALVDSLTNVFNRRYFEQQLNLEWRRLQRLSSTISLIMCDIDYFKKYNDTYGHQQGDRCLQQVAQAISTVTKRPADIVARYGGEEFAVILPHTPQSGAIKVAEDMRMAVKALKIPHLNSAVDSVVTLSVGVANTIPNSQDNSNMLLLAADLALYKAKELGRNCVAVYPYPISHSKNGQAAEINWIKRIRQALDNNLFSLYAQPIESLQTDDRQKHFEILLRLTDEENSVITPNHFLGIADRNSLMPKIDTWVVNNLLEKLTANGDSSSWQNHRFSINLSGASLNSESFLQFLQQKLRDYCLSPRLFCFEITETVAVTNFTQVASFIKSLKKLGCSFALDDFGKGMSSLTYLKNLPVDFLKIDGSFIKELNNNKASQVMVEAINHIAEGIGLKTVAEFVENQTILETVRDLNIDYAQGFHLGRPGVLMEVINSF